MPSGGGVGIPFASNHLAYGINPGNSGAAGREQSNFFTPSYAIAAESTGLVPSESSSTTIPDPLNSDPPNSLTNEGPGHLDRSTVATGDASLKSDLSAVCQADPPAQDDLQTTGNADASPQDDSASIAKAEPNQHELWNVVHTDHVNSYDQSTVISVTPPEQHDSRPMAISDV